MASSNNLPRELTIQIALFLLTTIVIHRIGGVSGIESLGGCAFFLRCVLPVNIEMRLKLTNQWSLSSVSAHMGLLPETEGFTSPGSWNAKSFWSETESA